MLDLSETDCEMLSGHRGEGVRLAMQLIVEIELGTPDMTVTSAVFIARVLYGIEVPVTVVTQED